MADTASPGPSHGPSDGPFLGPTRHKTNETYAASTPHPPHLPHTDAGAATTDGTAHAELPRKEKRAAWYENKIRESRNKQQQKRGAGPAEQGSHTATQTGGSETHATRDGRTSSTSTARSAPSSKHPVTKQKSTKTKKCAGCPCCSRKSTPPHAPDDRYAFRTGQSMAPFDNRPMPTRFGPPLAPHVHPASPYDNGSGYTQPGAWQQGGRRLPEPTPYTGLDTYYRGSGPHAAFSGPNYGVHNPYALGPPPPVRRDHGLGYQPLYNLHEGVTVTNGQNFQYRRPQMAQSQSSATQVGDPVPHVIVRTPKNDSWQEKTPVKRMAKLDVEGLLGMEPSTPATTGSHEFFEELGPTNDKLQSAAVMPDYESSKRAPRLQIRGSEWDTETKVTPSQHQSLVGDEVVLLKADELPVDVRFIERMMLTKLYLGTPLLPPVRSPSLPPGWDRESIGSVSTLELSNEDIEVLPKDDLFVKEQLMRSVAERFLAPREEWIG